MEHSPSLPTTTPPCHHDEAPAEPTVPPAHHHQLKPQASRAEADTDTGQPSPASIEDEKTEGRPAYAHEVFYKLHRKPDGSFSDPHSSQIDALYQSRLNEVTASNTPLEDIDRDAIYYDVAKTKKGVLGTGLLGTALASKCSSSTDGPSSSQNARWREELLGEMNTQMAAKVEEAVRSTQQRVEAEMRARMEAEIRARMEAEMSARMDAEMEKMRELVRQLAHPPPPPP
ncbi:hypothetical protein CASFOL_029048 [Castilleja foliolosa]|uniref:Uncharacterized protein n=1 Tax=Castilleja foliolosa TaxID=1961234 RepID=A0ABD3CFZ4_9LAMI